MSVSEETAAVVDRLPADKARSVLEFARFLADQAISDAWDASLGRAARSPAFLTELAEVDDEIAAGKDIELRTEDL